MTEKPTYDELERRVRELEKVELERKQAEKNTRGMCELLSLFLKHSPIYAFLKEVSHQESRVVFGSDNYIDMIGISVSQMIGKTMDELFPLEFAEKMTRDDIDVVFKGDNLEIEEDFKGRNYLTYKFPIMQGDKRYLAGYTIDITDRKQAEEQLRESRKRYAEIFEGSRDGFVMVDAAGRITDANRAFCEMLGYSLDELCAMPNFYKITPERWREWEAKEIWEKRLLGQGHSGLYEKEYIRKDGTVFPVELQSYTVRDENGQIAFLWGTARDITGRKRAEEALRESETRFRELFHSISDLVYTQDLDGRLLSMNPALCEAFGYDEEELVGRRVSDFMEPKFVEAFEGEYLAKLKKEGRHEGTSIYFTKEGERIYLEYRSSMVYPKEGEPYISGTGRDVTARILSETEKKKLQDQLSQARKMEAIGTLAGGIAHNFNNILMGVQGRTSLMLMDKAPSDPDYEHLRGIEEYVKNAVELTRDLLGFARGGKYEANPMDLNALIKHENRMFGRTKKEIRVHGKYEKDLWAVEADRGQMQQALLNLYVNAWQAMPAGGDLYIQTENVILDEEDTKPYGLAPGRYVRISVTDTGVGMNDAIRERIFDPFFSTKDVGRGSGLGLASVYGIIKNHNGFIHVYSEKGEGTTFNLYLPASEKEIAEEGPGMKRDKIQYGQGTVLLVDDEKMILDVGKKMLEKLGYRALSAGSGQEALDLYEKHGEEIDLVILDMIMPGMGGGETHDRLKEIDGGVNVILSSGYSIDGKATEIMQRGCSGFIQKPFSVEGLSRKVREALDERKGDDREE